MRYMAIALLLLAVVPSVYADDVSVDSYVTALGGERWQYEYIFNNSSSSPFNIRDIFIAFDNQEYSNLECISNDKEWKFLLITGGSFDTYSAVDIYTDGPGIAPSTSLGGFQITFDWIGAYEPGSQAFIVYDPDMWEEPLASGTTTIIHTLAPGPGAVPMPEPQTFVLLSAGLSGLLILRRHMNR